MLVCDCRSLLVLVCSSLQVFTMCMCVCVCVCVCTLTFTCVWTRVFGGLLVCYVENISEGEIVCNIYVHVCESFVIFTTSLYAITNLIHIYPQ